MLEVIHLIWADIENMDCLYLYIKELLLLISFTFNGKKS